MILALKSADEITELYLLSDNGEVTKEKKWNAERRLTTELLGIIDEMVKGDFKQLVGLVVFKGPGSFTGLRIGVTTMNTIAYSEDIPVVGTEGSGWLGIGLERLGKREDDKIVIPEYGAEANISLPKK